MIDFGGFTLLGGFVLLKGYGKWLLFLVLV
jgi:hypothetical protein